jgi:CheY-like chemotaxis protein
MPVILIIEDSDDVTALEIALASLNGSSIKVVNDGRQALALLDSTPHDIVAVITDLHLPIVDGFDVLTAIRCNDRYRTLPIIVISGDSDPEVRTRLYNLGANAFFTKPYSPATIRQTLEGLLYAS